MKDHHKLVRSKIPEYLKTKGIPFTVHIADIEEYTQKLYEKLLEEASELTKDRNIEELADLLEVIEAIKDLQGWTTREVEKFRLKKFEEKGGFDEPIILEKS
jgi:predicted house-cleaning noncanonical NTP pyrophosphatase (MazG superfamily)